VGVPAVDVVGADLAELCLLGADAAEMPAVEQVHELAFAGRDDLAAGQQHGLGGHVHVLGVIDRPVGGREILQQAQGRGDLENPVTVVVGVVVGGHRAVAGGDPQVTVRADGGCRPAHPDGSLALAGSGIDGEIMRCAALLRNRCEPAVVGRAVAVVPAVTEVHAPVIQGQPGALENVRRCLAGRIHVLR
jgi:hypothetical protein